MKLDDTPLRSSRLLEALRGRPRALVYSVILGHSLAMALAMLLVQASPPREVVEALVIGRESLLGTPAHPPLTGWVLGLAYGLGGGRMWALSLAGALADAVALWAVFRLARSIVGERQGALATVLLAGVAWVTWLPPALSPDRLLLPLFALTALHLWRAAGQGRRLYWGLVALDLALLVATRYSAAMLGGVLVLALVVTPKGRAVFRSPEPWGAVAVAAALIWPHILWVATDDGLPFDHAVGSTGAPGLAAAAEAWGGLLLLGVLGHAALAVLVALAVVPRKSEGDTVPVFPRPEPDVTARRFALTLVLAPAPAVAVTGLLLGLPAKTETLVPLFAFSGLGAVLLLGSAIPLYRHALVGQALVLATLAPPAVAALMALAAPYGRGPGADTNWPSSEIARWFTEVYRIRTGQPLALVAGDVWTGGTLALASHDRPQLYPDGNSARTPWITEETVARAGVLVVWRIEGANPHPPVSLRTRFPGMTIEAPRSFEWAIAGRLPPIRIGWAVIPPRGG